MKGGEALMKQERFTNAGGECIVLERSKRVPSTALIYRPCSKPTPFIVAIGHEPGAESWQHGKYYGSVIEAARELASWDETEPAKQLAADKYYTSCPEEIDRFTRLLMTREVFDLVGYGRKYTVEEIEIESNGAAVTLREYAPYTGAST